MNFTEIIQNYFTFPVVLGIQGSQLLTSMFVSILKDEKKFTAEEIGNDILPFYFYASLFGMLPISLLVLSCGDTISEIISIALLFGVDILAYFMNQRNFCVAKSIYFISAIASLLQDLMTKLYIQKRNPETTDSEDKGAKIPKDKALKKPTTTSALKANLLKCQKQFLFAVSSWIAQDIFFLTKSYNLIYFYSFLPNIIALGICFLRFGFLPMENKAQNPWNWESFQEIYSSIKWENAVGAVIYVVTTSASLSTTLKNNQFLMEIREKYGEGGKEVGKIEKQFNKIISFVFNFISYIIRFISRALIFLASPWNFKKDNNKVKYTPKEIAEREKTVSLSYVTPCLKLLGLLLANAIVTFVKKQHYFKGIFICAPLLALLLLGYSRCQNIKAAKYIYFLVTVMYAVLGIFSNEYVFGLKKSFLHKIVRIILLFVQNGLNSLIDFTGKRLKLKGADKMKFYSCLVFGTWLLFFMVEIKNYVLPLLINKDKD